MRVKTPDDDAEGLYVPTPLALEFLRLRGGVESIWWILSREIGMTALLMVMAATAGYLDGRRSWLIFFLALAIAVSVVSAGMKVDGRGFRVFLSALDFAAIRNWTVVGAAFFGGVLAQRLRGE